MLEDRVLARARRKLRDHLGHGRAFNGGAPAWLSEAGDDRILLRHPERIFVVDDGVRAGIVPVMRAHEDDRHTGEGGDVARPHCRRDHPVCFFLFHEKMPNRVVEVRSVHVYEEERAPCQPGWVECGCGHQDITR